ncbi:hypothetical protein EGR_08189 [Echinococcus granulosus]|uniref:Uncharacterized protein n=1 Tax=Echinococcus granulosus TaxID=6210 RepID=W6UFT8_ECHGR|nr:hypothetical protein EGR_08189 [Echinococcus granulosus]EUB56952.1 hypothetical protein EGR_08189 [Echinococcus granulosus]
MHHPIIKAFPIPEGGFNEFTDYSVIIQGHGSVCVGANEANRVAWENRTSQVAKTAIRSGRGGKCYFTTFPSLTTAKERTCKYVIGIGACEDMKVVPRLDTPRSKPGDHLIARSPRAEAARANEMAAGR